MTRRRRIGWSAVARALVAGTFVWLALGPAATSDIRIVFEGVVQGYFGKPTAIFILSNASGVPVREWGVQSAAKGSRVTHPLNRAGGTAGQIIQPGMAERIDVMSPWPDKPWRLEVMCSRVGMGVKINDWLEKFSQKHFPSRKPLQLPFSLKFPLYSEWISATNLAPTPSFPNVPPPHPSSLRLPR